MLGITQFIIMAYDENDENVLARERLFGKNILNSRKDVSKKKHLYTTAIMDDYGHMIGTLLPGRLSDVKRNSKF